MVVLIYFIFHYFLGTEEFRKFLNYKVKELKQSNKDNCFSGTGKNVINFKARSYTYSYQLSYMNEQYK